MRIRALTLFSLLFCSTQIWSWDCAACEDLEGKWFISGSLGRSFYQMDKSNYINSGPNWPEDFYFKNKIHDAGLINIAGGYAITRYTDWFPMFMLSLQYEYAYKGKVTGSINQYDLTQFQNYHYSYDFTRNTFMLLFKATFFRYCNFLPYFTAGAGPSFNKGSGFSETPLLAVTPRISPGFGSDTTTSFSYLLGVGVDYAYNDSLMIGLEYNYADYGKVNTGNGANTETVTGFNYSGQHLTNTLKANTVLLRLTYLFNCA